MAETVLDDLPGFRRRIVVRPGPGAVRSDVEDDYHHMGVLVRHDGQVATAVEADMTRIPWTTCPGAPAALTKTFTGVPLAGFGVRGERTTNCTHLHDLAVLAGAHAHDAAPLVYDVLVSDAVEGRVIAELRRDGETVMRWVLADNRLVEPAGAAGRTVMELRPFVDSLDETGKEYARILRWGCILAHGRLRLAGEAYDKDLLPRGQCFTFQPENAPNAKYTLGTIKDFSLGPDQPLGDLVVAGGAGEAVAFTPSERLS